MISNLNLLPDPINPSPDLTGSHRYFIGRENWPGVSEILQSAGLIDLSKIPPDRLEYARVRGTAVHLACHYYDLGILNWDSVDPVISGYVRSYVAFIGHTDYRVLGSELSLTSKIWRFCGTLDRIAEINKVPSIVDLKTALISRPVTKLQTAGYHILANDNFPELKTRKRFELKLFEDGSIGELIPFNDLEADIQTFLWAVSLHHWKIKNLKQEALT